MELPDLGAASKSAQADTGQCSNRFKNGGDAKRH
jgi:hypothetical protein